MINATLYRLFSLKKRAGIGLKTAEDEVFRYNEHLRRSAP